MELVLVQGVLDKVAMGLVVLYQVGMDSTQLELDLVALELGLVVMGLAEVKD